MKRGEMGRRKKRMGEHRGEDPHEAAEAENNGPRHAEYLLAEGIQ
jgi:hypothetical protein